MPDTVPPQAVVVSRENFDSGDAYDLVEVNVVFINALLNRHFRIDEMAEDALRSYYVDYYLAEMQNGGFSQFVYNSRWSEAVLTYVRDGLREMGASRYLDLFEEGARQVEQLGAEQLAAFLESDYFGDNPVRDELNAPNEAFFALAEQEDLTELNAAWLRSLPHLVVLTDDEIGEELERRVAALPDLAERIALARENEPRYTKLIRALCEQTGHTFDAITAGDPAHEHEGQATLAWHFLTDQGHFYMVDTGRQALMFDGDTNQLIASLDLPE